LGVERLDGGRHDEDGQDGEGEQVGTDVSNVRGSVDIGLGGKDDDHVASVGSPSRVLRGGGTDEGKRQVSLVGNSGTVEGDLSHEGSQH
jgi:hypothetical protein